MKPARLGQQIGHGAAQEIGRGNEVGVEDGDELATHLGHGGRQRASLEARTFLAMQQLDGQPLGAIALDAGRGQRGGLVGGIVQQLNLQAIGRVVQRRQRVDQTLHHVQLVEHRRLHSDRGPFGRLRRLGRRLTPASQIEDRQPQGVGAIDGQNNGHQSMKPR